MKYYRHILPLLCLLALIPVHSLQADRTTIVVELYTSQGCSSCPPADALLRELADEPDIIPLSLHVDYWDRLGWKDPFAQAQFTERQRQYALSLPVSRGAPIYTPQMVVDGRAGVVGSYKPGVRAAIDAARGQDTVTPRFIVGEATTLQLPATPKVSRATVWLASYDRRHTTAVQRGENTGRELVNDFVVRELYRLSDWSGSAEEFPIDLEHARRQGRDGLVAFVQTPNQGPILGATRLTLNPVGASASPMRLPSAINSLVTAGTGTPAPRG